MRKILASAISEAVQQQCRKGMFHIAIGNPQAEAIKAAVNQGIDAHLEACFIPDRGDSYEWNGRQLVCEVSPQSLPVLVRRLNDGDDTGMILASEILDALEFKTETGCFEVVSAVDEGASR